jgi:predicted metal-binding membrane protein
VGGVTAAAPPVPPAVARQRNIILVVLLGLAVVGWLVFLDEANDPAGMSGAMHDGMNMATNDGGPELTMGGSWPLFLSMWVAMMVAMMFPAAAPMVVMYGRMRRSDPPSVAVFTAAYIALWFVFGVGAYLLSAGVEAAASESDWVAMNWGRAGGALLVLAGVFQFTPLKDICLRNCRTPMAFVMTHWHDGRSGALRMGLIHGAYCVGCCWLLFLILIPLGLMNVAAMVAVAALVFAEKVVPHGRAIGIAASVVMIVYGIAVMARPELLPTVA